MKRLLSGLLVLALTTTVVAGEDEKTEKTEEEKYPVVDSSEARKQIASFQRTFQGTKDIDLQLDAVTKLGRSRHKYIVKELLKLMRHEDAHIGAEAMKGLANQVPFRKMIARRLEHWLDEEETHPRVVAATIQAAGALDATNVEETIIKLINSNEDDVAIAALEVLAKWRCYGALREIVILWEFYPDDGKWEGGSVKVDTGASGNKDQKAAQAKYKAKYGNREKRARPYLVQAIRKSVNEILGVEEEEKLLKQPDELREWMSENKAFLRRHR